MENSKMIVVFLCLYNTYESKESIYCFTDLFLKMCPKHYPKMIIYKNYSFIVTMIKIKSLKQSVPCFLVTTVYETIKSVKYLNFLNNKCIQITDL